MNSDRARACGRNGGNYGDACIRSLRTSRPFLGPRRAFAPRRAAPRVQKQINSDRARACGGNGVNWGDACIRGFRASRPFLGPLPAFALRPGSAQRDPWARKSREKTQNSDRARACGGHGEWNGDACIRGLRASEPFLGPLQAFPVPGSATQAPIWSEKNETQNELAHTA
jgi:hypothetical protein